MKTIALNILDIVQNSVRAEATRISIEIKESQACDIYRLSISDNGKGMKEELLKRVTDPFVTTRTKRRLGLGLPLLKYHAGLAGGGLEIASEYRMGTSVHATFSYSHPDRQPMGDIPGVIKILIASEPLIEFTYRHITDTGEFNFSTEEAKEVLEVKTLNDRELLGDIETLIYENLKEIGASGILRKEMV